LPVPEITNASFARACASGVPAGWGPGIKFTAGGTTLAGAGTGADSCCPRCRTAHALIVMTMIIVNVADIDFV
jgi:hypothetical protein